VIEFTGERLVPDQVDPDLWNEHIARYCFAARLAKNKRVLDVACGLGYGSAELAKVAASVQAIDISSEAIEEARRRYAAHNIQFTTAPAQCIPFPDASFDLIVAFEVIEHLEDWPSLLAETRRLLAPGGQLIISTPNRSFYAETRRLAGPNPFHVHEFDFAEFRDALTAHFSAVTLFLQNHVAAISFQPEHAHQSAELAFEPSKPEPESTHFFLAVCATAPQTGAPLYLYLPATANVLKEREAHISKLEGELTQKDTWLGELKLSHAALLESHHTLEKTHAETIEWAQRLDQEVVSARLRIAELDDQIVTLRRAVEETVAGYEAKIEELQSDLAARTASALQNESRLESELAAKTNELAACVKLLQEAEALAEERTRWAQSLDARITELESTLATAGNSRWLRLGRKLGVGPQLQS
jgi:ubiquinone/menaquinone biosynthesis C-methylase UbiE